MLTTLPSGLLIDLICLPLAGAGVIGFVVLWLRRREWPRRCPGPKRRLRSPRGCGYDLRSQTGPAITTLTCPECGRVFVHGERVEAIAGWRLRRGAITIAVVLGTVAWVPTMPWRTISPDLALAIGERLLGTRMPIGARDEVVARAIANDLDGWSLALVADAAILELGDDGERGNAVRATRILRAFNEHDVLGMGLVDRLQNALDSDDHQRRQFAAHFLRRTKARPSRRMLEVSYEGLAHDGIASWTGLSNARECRWYLERHAEAAEDLLLKGFDSTDLQQRVRCASIVLGSDLVAHHPLACEVLISHLADNLEPEDAWIARRSLASHGRPALKALERYRESGDDQQRQYVRWLIDHIHRLPQEPPAPTLHVGIEQALVRGSFAD